MLPELCDAIRAVGYEPPSNIAVGKVTRFSTNGKRNDISKMQVRHKHRGRQTLPEMPYQQRTDAGARHYAGYMYHYDAECRPNSVQGTSRPSR